MKGRSRVRRARRTHSRASNRVRASTFRVGIGQASPLEVHAQGNILPLIETKVTEGTLRIPEFQGIHELRKDRGRCRDTGVGTDRPQRWLARDHRWAVIGRVRCRAQRRLGPDSERDGEGPLACRKRWLGGRVGRTDGCHGRRRSVRWQPSRGAGDRHGPRVLPRAARGSVSPEARTPRSTRPVAPTWNSTDGVLLLSRLPDYRALEEGTASTPSLQRRTR